MKKRTSVTTKEMTLIIIKTVINALYEITQKAIPLFCALIIIETLPHTHSLTLAIIVLIHVPCMVFRYFTSDKP